MKIRLLAAAALLLTHLATAASASSSVRVLVFSPLSSTESGATGHEHEASVRAAFQSLPSTFALRTGSSVQLVVEYFDTAGNPTVAVQRLKEANQDP